MTPPLPANDDEPALVWLPVWKLAEVLQMPPVKPAS